jgi:histone H1/5
MAIIYRNPMPMSGAFFIENPKRKKSSRKRKSVANRTSLRRRNGPKVAMMAKYSGLTRKQIRQLNKTDYAAAKVMFEAAGGQSALERLRGEKLPDGRRAGRAFGAALGRLKKKYSKEFNNTAQRKKIEAAFFAGRTVKIGNKTIDPRAEAGLMGVDEGRYSSVTTKSKTRKSTARKSTARKSKASKSKASKSTARKSTASKSMQLSRTQNGRYRLGNKFISKADAASIMGIDVNDMDLMALNNPRGRTMRRNAWYNDKAGHRKAALKGWRKRRAAMNKKKKAPAKRKARKSVAKKRKSTRTVSATHHKSLLKKAHKAVSKRNFRSAKSRMKAVWAEYKKLAKGKSSGKKTVAKATRGKARSAAQKRSVARKTSAWQKFLKKMGNRGLSRVQLKRLYKKSKSEQSVIAKQFPKIRKKKGSTAKRRRGAISRRGAIRVSKSRSGKGRGAHQPLMGPYMARLNPAFSVGGILQRFEGFVEDIPVVRTLAPAVIPIALGAGVYYVHRMAEPYVMPLVTKVGGIVAQVPVIGKAVPFLLSKPYTMTGIVASGALALLSRYDLISRQDAAMIGGTAIAMGVGLDLSLKPFAQAAIAVQEQVAAIDPMAAQEEIAMANADMGAIQYGDGGQYIIGAPTQDLGGIASDYNDATAGDSYVSGEDMHDEESSAAVAGDRYFFNKFGQSPRRITGKKSIYSRHAGRKGHRWAWLIKMIGFANFQKIAALPPHQRRQVIARLRRKAMSSVPSQVAAAQAAQPMLESASLPIDGASNGACGADGLSYGALMFAGNGY